LHTSRLGAAVAVAPHGGEDVVGMHAGGPATMMSPHWIPSVEMMMAPGCRLSERLSHRGILQWSSHRARLRRGAKLLVMKSFQCNDDLVEQPNDCVVQSGLVGAANCLGSMPVDTWV
jgi:hypothetical protein